MTLCKLIEMNLPNGIIASIEGNTKEEVLADIVDWLHEFYKREGKVFDKQGSKTKGKERWAYNVQENGRSVGKVKVEYLRQFQGVEDGRRVRRQRFGIYFDTRSGQPSGTDRDNFLKYVRKFVVEIPQGMGNYSHRATTKPY